MTRYIDADNILYKDLSEGRGVCWITFKDWIKEMPTADVRENVKGEWIDNPVYKQTMDGKTWDGFTYCSECKKIYEYGYRSKFCPNCGAIMKKRKKRNKE